MYVCMYVCVCVRMSMCVYILVCIHIIERLTDILSCNQYKGVSFGIEGPQHVRFRIVIQHICEW